tara:strand:- start:5011 stop:5376 length:366 start_codon:yes stop_codon:yes gene_type:complete
MSFQESITQCMSQYATFEGRASRSEFWWFYLFSILMQWFAQVVFTITGGAEIGSIFSGLVSLIFVVPLLAVSARRLHDTNKSGWRYLWCLTIIGIIPVVIWWASEGSRESNEYGEPKNLNL